MNNRINRWMGHMFVLVCMFHCIQVYATVQLTHEVDSVFYRRLKKIEKNFPLDLRDGVESLIKEKMYKYREESQLLLARAAEILPIIEKELWSRAFPSDFKYVPLALSGLDPGHIGRNGGSGIWQLQYISAIRYGLDVNEWIDERRDIQRSTTAAVEHLAFLHKLYNNWGLAALAFFSSPAEVNAAIKRNRGISEFWGVYNNTTPNTRQSYQHLIAMIYLVNYYQDYDMKHTPISEPDLIWVNAKDKPVKLTNLANWLHIPADQLLRWNAVYRLGIVPANTKYQILIPKEKQVLYENYTETEVQLIKPNAEVLNETEQTTVQFTEKNTGENADKIIINQTREVKETQMEQKTTYTVVKGDNLSKIARKFYVSPEELRTSNNIKGDHIYAGQKLIITKKKKITTPEEHPKTEDNPKISEEKKSVFINAAGEWETYKVKAGDTIYGIASRFGVSQETLIKNNDIKNNLIHPGQEIKIKRK